MALLNNVTNILSQANVTVNHSSFNNVTDNQTENAFSDVVSLRHKLNIAQYVICPLLVIVGVSGNMMTIITVSDTKFRRLTSRYFLCALAIADSLLLLTNPFNQQFMTILWNRDLRAISDIGCKFFFIVYRTGKMSASWFIVMVAGERLCAVVFPLHVKTILRKQKILLAIAAVYICMTGLSVGWIFSTKSVNGTCLPDAVTPDTALLHKRFVVSGATFYSLAPICILLTITPPIIYKLVKHNKARQRLGYQASNALERSARETSKTSVMLIGILVSYIICVMPITLLLLLTFWTNEPIFGSNKKEFVILASVAQTFEQINHSSNFFIYVLFSSQFRQRLLQKIGLQKSEASEIETHGVSYTTTSRTDITVNIVNTDINSSQNSFVSNGK